jgi:hypothetical protein
MRSNHFKSKQEQAVAALRLSEALKLAKPLLPVNEEKTQAGKKAKCRPVKEQRYCQFGTWYMPMHCTHSTNYVCMAMVSTFVFVIKKIQKNE